MVGGVLQSLSIQSPSTYNLRNYEVLLLYAPFLPTISLEHVLISLNRSPTLVSFTSYKELASKFLATTKLHPNCKLLDFHHSLGGGNVEFQCLLVQMCYLGMHIPAILILTENTVFNLKKTHIKDQAAW